MSDKFFFLTTFDNISGALIASALNEHPDIHCSTSYADPFIINSPILIQDVKHKVIDSFIDIESNTKIKFTGNTQRFSCFELQHRMLSEKTTHIFRRVNIALHPITRIQFLLYNWINSAKGAKQSLVHHIEKTIKKLAEKNNHVSKLYNFDYFYNHIIATAKKEKIDLFNLDNKLFLSTLAKVITFDSGDLPVPAKTFCFEKLIESEDTFFELLNYVTYNQIELNDNNKSIISKKLPEISQQVKEITSTQLENWKIDFIRKYTELRLETVYYPHLDTPLSAFYSKLGYNISTETEQPATTGKLISIQLNSNRPTQLADYFDNIEETTDHPEEIEVLVNIDLGDTAMESMLLREIPHRKFTIKYISTPKPKSFCDLWKPINSLLNITDPNSYFLLNISDEMLFLTKGWDTILKKYVGFFPDHIFRLRASRNKFRNYYDRWECSFTQDAIPITTKKWVDIGGDWNPCFGPDSFQQLVAFYLAKEGEFNNKHYLRDIPIIDIKFAGDVPAIGIDPKKLWEHSSDHIYAMEICQSYKIQLEARRRAVLLKAHIFAEENQLHDYEIIDKKRKKQIHIRFINNKDKSIQIMSYYINRFSITLTNQWRKLFFFSYFGDGHKNNPNIIRSFARYLKAKYKYFNLYILPIYKLLRHLLKPKSYIKSIRSHKENILEENKQLRSMYQKACLEKEILKSKLDLSDLIYQSDNHETNLHPSSTCYPKISIIIGVLNMRQYLGNAIESVINQHYPNLELIIMDGGSTDGTLDVIKKYENHIHIWKSQKDRGHADACNTALDFVTGDLISLLNADDILGDGLLHKVAALYHSRPKLKMITCGVKIIENSENDDNVILELTKPEKLQLTLKNVLFELPVINARFFHKDIFKEYGKFNATDHEGKYNLSNDRDFLSRLAIHGIRSEIIPEPLYIYLSHPNSLTFNKKNLPRIYVEHIRLAETLLNKNIPTDRKLVQQWLTTETVNAFLVNCIQGNIVDALKLARYGLIKFHLQWIKQLFMNTSRSVIKKLGFAIE